MIKKLRKFLSHVTALGDASPENLRDINTKSLKNTKGTALAY
jgi:hypothetical protein